MGREVGPAGLAASLRMASPVLAEYRPTDPPSSPCSSQPSSGVHDTHGGPRDRLPCVSQAAQWGCAHGHTPWAHPSLMGISTTHLGGIGSCFIKEAGVFPCGVCRGMERGVEGADLPCLPAAPAFGPHPGILGGAGARGEMGRRPDRPQAGPGHLVLLQVWALLAMALPLPQARSPGGAKADF